MARFTITLECTEEEREAIVTIAALQHVSMGKETFKAWQTLHPEIAQIVKDIQDAGGPDAYRIKRTGLPRSHGRYGRTVNKDRLNK